MPTLEDAFYLDFGLMNLLCPGLWFMKFNSNRIATMFVTFDICVFFSLPLQFKLCSANIRFLDKTDLHAFNLWTLIVADVIGTEWLANIAPPFAWSMRWTWTIFKFSSQRKIVALLIFFSSLSLICMINERGGKHHTQNNGIYEALVFMHVSRVNRI